MELITSDERRKLFDAIEREAFHLELRDWYFTSTEDEPLRKWLKGEPDDYEWFEPWLSLVRRLTNGGRTVRRVRVVTEPISGYIRFEHFDAHLNIEAGEDIRWLPRHRLPEGIVFPCAGRDFWLFDDRLAAFGHFDADGRALGSQVVTDPSILERCTQVRDQLWPLAIPHSQYQPV